MDADSTRERSRYVTADAVNGWMGTARRSTRYQAEPGDECVPKRELGNEGRLDIGHFSPLNL